jgi:hypothetical protein
MLKKCTFANQHIIVHSLTASLAMVHKKHSLSKSIKREAVDGDERVIDYEKKVVVVAEIVEKNVYKR